MPAEAIATSVPAPIARPTSAWAKAGASFTPSPTMATLRPFDCRSLTRSFLSSGRTCASMRSIPSSRPTASATFWASPVSMAVSMPRSYRAWIASRAAGRTSSARASAPIVRPSLSTWSTVRPSRSHCSLGRACAPVCSSSPGPPTRICAPSTTADTPIAVELSCPEACGISRPRSCAAWLMARASGCWLRASAAAARAISRSSSRPSGASSASWTPSRAGSPRVRVPVLSKTTVSIPRMVSSALRSVTSTP